MRRLGDISGDLLPSDPGWSCTAVFIIFVHTI